jgi:hypothetical protein
MNVPVIARQVADALQRVVPGTDLTSETFEEDRVRVTMNWRDALVLIDFIEEHKKTRRPSQRQVSLFGPTDQ